MAHYFQAKLDRPRISVEDDGNVGLYSLNRGLEDNTWWKIVILPSTVPCIEGSIVKVVDGNPSMSSWDEAESALYGNFTKLSSAKKIESSKVAEFQPTIRKEVAFTLRVNQNDVKGLSKLKDFENHNKEDTIKNISFAVETGPVNTGNVVICVYGLLTSDGDGLDLEVYLDLIGNIFPSEGFDELITWLTYCTDEDRWRKYIHSENH